MFFISVSKDNTEGLSIILFLQKGTDLPDWGAVLSNKKTGERAKHNNQLLYLCHE